MWSILSLLLLAIPLALGAHQPAVNHRELAKRAKGDIQKRADGARWTFYSTGLGACGATNTDSDFIVALNQQTFGYSYPSPYCWKKIRMTYNGRTTEATITDSCPGCPVNGLDLSPGLFSFFASQDLGVIYGSWEFVDGSGGGGGDGGDDTPTTTKQKPTTTHHTTTSTTHTTPTTTSTTPTTTHTTTSSTPTTTPSTTHSSAKESSASHSDSSSASASSSATPSPTISAEHGLAAASGTISPTSTADPENLYSFAQAFLGLTGIVVAGAGAQ